MCFSAQDHKYEKLLRLCYEGSNAPTPSSLSKMQAYVALNPRRSPQVAEQVFLCFSDALRGKNPHYATISVEIIHHIVDKCPDSAHLFGSVVVRMVKAIHSQGQSEIVVKVFDMLYSFTKSQVTSNCIQYIPDLIYTINMFCPTSRSSTQDQKSSGKETCPTIFPIPRIEAAVTKALYGLLQHSFDLLPYCDLLLQYLLSVICTPALHTAPKTNDDGFHSTSYDLACSSIQILASNICIHDIDKFFFKLMITINGSWLWQRKDLLFVAFEFMLRGLENHTIPIYLDQFISLHNEPTVGDETKVIFMEALLHSLKALDAPMGPNYTHFFKRFIAMVVSQAAAANPNTDLLTELLSVIQAKAKDLPTMRAWLLLMVTDYAEFDTSISNPASKKLILITCSYFADCTRDMFVVDFVSEKAMSEILRTILQDNKDLSLLALRVLSSLLVPAKSNSQPNSPVSTKLGYSNEIMWRMCTVFLTILTDSTNTPEYIQACNVCLCRAIDHFYPRSIQYLVPMIFSLQSEVIAHKTLPVSMANTLHVVMLCILDKACSCYHLESLEQYLTKIWASWPNLEIVCPHFRKKGYILEALAGAVFSFESEPSTQIQTLFVPRKVVKKIVKANYAIKTQYPEIVKHLLRPFDPTEFVDILPAISDEQITIDIEELTSPCTSPSPTTAEDNLFQPSPESNEFGSHRRKITSANSFLDHAQQDTKSNGKRSQKKSNQSKEKLLDVSFSTLFAVATDKVCMLEIVLLPCSFSICRFPFSIFLFFLSLHFFRFESS
eukprot:TRINITY_DN2597_c0_g1_i12.p1 TRINITY_DN2597_c0_g1~~TRINITY_DN2597_c0_g1_i12.p1  ORF type:complete len:778 (+),score=105.24 TRINITY_DN2597_c0_g1_i12:48-2381(+)